MSLLKIQKEFLRFTTMLILLSPAKRLNEVDKENLLPSNTPYFFDEAVKVNKSTKRLSAKKLMALQGISADLAGLNQQRNQLWNTMIDKPEYKKAIFMFSGDAYLGLEAETMKEKTLQYAQDHLRILSGLYGLLKPLDLIEPYRLEMGTKINIGRSKNLYEFWRKKITALLEKEFKKELIFNLASKEYAKAIDFKKLNNRVIEFEFKDRNAKGEYKVMSFFAKKARGMMARYILEYQIEDVEKLKLFSLENYTFSQPLSEDDKLVFLRDH